MNWKTLLSDNKQIIAALIAGALAIVAAYIRRGKSGDRAGAKISVLGLLLLPFFYLLLGVGLLAVEFFAMNVDAKDGSYGEILCLAGCVFVVAAVVWLPINLTRLVFWPRPKETVSALPAVQAAGSGPVPVPPASRVRKP